MGYRHINNLYKDQAILMFRECYALEKIHGTSAHVGWKDGALHFFSGGEKHERFRALFNHADLEERFRALGHAAVTVYGEAYGGSQQGMAKRYGPELRFVAFEVLIGETWLAVPSAHDVATKLGVEFVHYARVSTDIDRLNAERDAPSEQARRNGVDGDQPREGVVLRPTAEMRMSNGERVMSKHKRDDERETATPRNVDPGKLAVIQAADAIAIEWVTPTRLEHVRDHLLARGVAFEAENMRAIITEMTEDVIREGAGEIVDSREARKAIGKRTVQLAMGKLKSNIRVPL